MFHGILRKKKQMRTHAVTINNPDAASQRNFKRRRGIKPSARIRGVRFGTAVSGTAERKTENYVPEMRAYSLSKSARLK